MRIRVSVLVSALLVLSILLIWYFRLIWRSGESERPTATPPGISSSATKPGTENIGTSDLAPTSVSAHNLMLRKGPSFRVYVRWLRGQMARALRNVNPSFDDPDSFFLDIKTGVLRTNVGDLNNFLNASGIPNSPLKNIKLSGNGDQITLDATLHKVVPLPIEVTGTISVAPGNLIQIHVTKLGLLKIPFKALLGGLHVSVADLFQPHGIEGIQVSGNDIVFDTGKLMPPPHIRGQLTNVRIVNPDVEEIYGDAQNEVTQVEQWRNFIRLRGGTIDFGKLTMHQVDLIMIDISNDPWFDIDLANYQEQLVNGYTRMTPQAGMQIFMPDLREIAPNKANQNISMEWLKHRNLPPPPEITSR